MHVLVAALIWTGQGKTLALKSRRKDTGST
jgi:hypothetical protein